MPDRSALRSGLSPDALMAEACVPCPYCHAQAGEPCVTRTAYRKRRRQRGGKPGTACPTHSVRRDAWEQAGRPRSRHDLPRFTPVLQTFHVWRSYDGGGAALCSAEHDYEYVKRVLFEEGDRPFLAYKIEAATSEEASAVYNLREGFGPYTPMGETARCTVCKQFYWPGSSGVCWACGTNHDLLRAAGGEE